MFVFVFFFGGFMGLCLRMCGLRVCMYIRVHVCIPLAHSFITHSLTSSTNLASTALAASPSPLERVALLTTNANLVDVFMGLHEINAMGLDGAAC